MATLAEMLRQTGYAKDGQLEAPAPTQPNLTTMAGEYIRQLPQKFNENQAEQMALLARAFPDNTLKNADPKAMVEMAMQTPFNALTAFHGTPHKILGKFDISKVGTGASANNFGHGIYFAESPDIASAFMASRNKISDPTEGNLYKVDIPDEHIPHMLDWYKPLAEQTPEVQAAIQKLGDKFRPLDELEASNVTGERLYRRIENSLGKHFGNLANPEASKMLNDAGIKGVKYENMQMVRGQGVGTNNYVVFDPSEVKILNKYENNLNRKELIQDQIDKLE